MSDDIVDRLKEPPNQVREYDPTYHVYQYRLGLLAADEIERLNAENARLREALKTYACRCGDGDCYKDEFVASCGRSAREALGLILNANSLNYAQEIASRALGEEKK